MESQWLNGINRDLTLIALVGQVPFWAQQFPGTACGPIDPDHLAEFGSFMHDLVSRYSQEPFNIKYWEIWNEPDIDWRAVSAASPFGCWGIREDPHFGGGAYGEMLKVIYPRIKAADPEAQVLVGGLLLDCDPRQPPEIPAGSGQIKDCTPARFLQGVLEAGGGDYFDGVSFHAYDFYFGEPGQYGNPNWHAAWDNSGPVLIQKARFLRELLNSYGYADKVLLNTEVALLCGSSGFEAVCQTRSMEETKASYVAQAYAAARAEGLLANVWYNLKGWRASGLATNGLQPLPAFTAYKFSAAMLDGAAYLGEVAEYPGVRGYRFQKDGSTFWIVWSRDGGTHTLTLPETPAAVFDVFGDPLPAAETLDVELAPIYITWSE